MFDVKNTENKNCFEWRRFCLYLFFLSKNKNKIRFGQNMSPVNIKDSPAIKDYCVLEIIGTGSYSIVYRARQKQVVVIISDQSIFCF